MEVGAQVAIPCRRRAVPLPRRPSVVALAGAAIGGLLLVASLLSVPTSSARAAAAEASGAVLGPWVDILPMDPAGAEAGPSSSRSAGSPRPWAGPRLLAVAPPDVHEPGTIHLTLLERDPVAWVDGGRLDVHTGLATAGAGELVPIPGGALLVASDAAAQRTSVTRLTGDPGDFRAGSSVVLDFATSGVGSADVDADGTPELLLLEDVAPANRFFDCRSKRVTVLDSGTLATRLGPTDLGANLDWAAVGRFDAAGDGLVGAGTPRCGVDATQHSPSGIVAVDLRTGATRPVRDLTGSSGSFGDGPSRPLLADVDRDGIDEIIIRAGGDTEILDPARDWRSTTIARGAIPLAVIGAGPGSVRLALFRFADPGGSGPLVELRSVVGSSGRFEMDHGGPDVAVGQGSGQATPPTIGRVGPSAPLPAWLGDLDGSGCPSLLLPSATFRACGAFPIWTGQRGPRWIATVPIASYGPARGRRLLVAAGVAWGSSGETFAVPAPAVSAFTGRIGWRGGPSSPFVLEELDAADVAYFPTFPVPAIDLDGNAGSADAPVMTFGGTAGDRVFARLTATRPRAAGPAPTAAYAPDPGGGAVADFLARPDAGGSSPVAVVPVPPSSTSGADPGSVQVPLPLAVEPPSGEGAGAGTDPGGQADPADGVPRLAAAWSVTAVGLNAYGEPSDLVTNVLAIDTTGPDLTVEAPFLSPPWPFSAALHGRVEPGARVAIDGEPLVDPALTGAFTLPARLAPWPQEVHVRAVDEHGNVTRRTLILVGGLDYRRLPWQTLAVVAVLLGAAATTWRGPTLRRRRDERSSPDAAIARAAGGRSHGIRSGRSPEMRSGRAPIATVAGSDGRRFGGPDLVAEPAAEIEDLPSPTERR